MTIILFIIIGILLTLLFIEHSASKSKIIETDRLDPKLKSIVDKHMATFYNSSSTPNYEEELLHLARVGSSYMMDIKDLVDSFYSKAKVNTADIPSFKHLLSLWNTIFDNPEQYEKKSVSIEGYITYINSPFSFEKTNISDNWIEISPIPCNTVWEKKILNDAELFSITRCVQVCSDKEITLAEGNYVRICGHPYFFEDSNGNPKGCMRILAESITHIKN